ncbi:MAG: glycosyltransferase family 4 protein [Acetivibrionales bacterium]
MRILAVNKFFYLKGGCETYYFALNKALKDKGYDIIHFSMKDEKNAWSPYENYFVNNIDYYDKNILKRIRYGAKIIYSMEAKNKISKLIRDSNPQLAHLHNFYHQLSPSILKEIKRNEIPIVFTAHDLKLICPDYQMLNRGEVCEKCSGKKFIACTLNRCMKNSLSASLISTAEMYIHSMLKSFEAIDIIITPSKFYRNKFIEFGYAPEKVVHIPNFVDTKANRPNYSSQGYIAYVGRLSKEKGIMTLIQAMKNVKNIDLYIVGEGPLKSEAERQVEQYNLSNIKILGFQTGKNLASIIKNSKFTVLPSEWYENSPMSVFESMAYGKAVIGSNIGGIPELIEHGKTGMIFESKNSEQLAQQINYLAGHPKTAGEMGREARRKAELEYGKEKHFERIEQIYKKLIIKRLSV